MSDYVYRVDFDENLGVACFSIGAWEDWTTNGNVGGEELDLDDLLDDNWEELSDGVYAYHPPEGANTVELVVNLGKQYLERVGITEVLETYNAQLIEQLESYKLGP